MSLWVHATGVYRSEVGTKWRPADYDVRNLVKSLKGEPFKGYSDVQFDGKSYRITAADNTPAYDLWSRWAAARLAKLHQGKMIVVPVPASDQVKYTQDTCPVRMASKVAALLPQQVVVGNLLRHKAKQPKAHTEGGTRDPDLIQMTLECRVTPADTKLPVVLIDDVMTTGGHLIAAARVLRERGVNVENVLVAGRAKREAVANPYKVPPEDIEACPFDDFTL